MSPVILAVAALVSLVIGGSILGFPVLFYDSYGVTLGAQPNLLSELRAQGALLVGAGVFVSLGVFRRERRRSSLAFGAVLFGCYVGARLFSWLVDGAPTSALIQAAAAELLLCYSCAHAWFRERGPQVDPPIG